MARSQRARRGAQHDSPAAARLRRRSQSAALSDPRAARLRAPAVGEQRAARPRRGRGAHQDSPHSRQGRHHPRRRARRRSTRDDVEAVRSEIESIQHAMLEALCRPVQDVEAVRSEIESIGSTRCWKRCGGERAPAGPATNVHAAADQLDRDPHLRPRRLRATPCGEFAVGNVTGGRDEKFDPKVDEAIQTLNMKDGPTRRKLLTGTGLVSATAAASALLAACSSTSSSGSSSTAPRAGGRELPDHAAVEVQLRQPRQHQPVLRAHPVRVPGCCRAARAFLSPTGPARRPRASRRW